MSSLPGTFSLQTAVRTFGLARCFPSTHRDLWTLLHGSLQFNHHSQHKLHLQWWKHLHVLNTSKHHTLKCIPMLPQCCHATYGLSLNSLAASRKRLTPCSRHAPHTCSFNHLRFTSLLLSFILVRLWCIQPKNLILQTSANCFSISISHDPFSVLPRNRSKSFKNRLPFFELFT